MGAAAADPRRTRRQLSACLAGCQLPRADYVLPVLVGVAAALVFFFLQKDLGPALFLSCVFLAMYAVATSAQPGWPSPGWRCSAPGSMSAIG